MRRRGSFVLILLPLCTALGTAATRPVMGQVSRNAPEPLTSLAVRLPLLKGFIDGKAVYYASLEASDAAFARSMGAAFAPRLAKAKEEGTDEFFEVTNGVQGQEPVMGSPPGDPDYSPIWRLVRVTWKPGTRKKLLASEADIDDQGQNLVEQETPIRFNCPVILMSDNLQGNKLHVAPTLDLGHRLVLWDVPSGTRRGTALYRVEVAWHDGQLFGFLDMEGGPQGMKPNGPLVAAVPKLSLNKLGNSATPSENAAAEFWTVQFQEFPVFDSIPEPDDLETYSPLWHVNVVTFNTGRHPRPLTSKDEIAAAVAAGDVTVSSLGPDAVFNCPVIDARAAVPLPLVGREIDFLSRAGILSAADARILMQDVRSGKREQFLQHADALTRSGKLQPETEQLLLQLRS